MNRIQHIYSLWGRHPYLYAAQDWITFLGRHKSIRNQAVQAIRAHAGSRVLDLACGTGRNFAYILESIGSKGELVGFDYSQEMLAAASALCQRKGWQKVRLIQGDAAKLDAGRKKFDGIICVLGMTAIPNYKKALSCCYELLRVGGILSVCDAKLFPGKLRIINPLIKKIYEKWAGWHPARNLPKEMNKIFGNVSVEHFNIDSFYIATSIKRSASIVKSGSS